MFLEESFLLFYVIQKCIVVNGMHALWFNLPICHNPYIFYGPYDTFIELFYFVIGKLKGFYDAIDKVLRLEMVENVTFIGN